MGGWGGVRGGGVDTNTIARDVLRQLVPQPWEQHFSEVAQSASLVQVMTQAERPPSRAGQTPSCTTAAAAALVLASAAGVGLLLLLLLLVTMPMVPL